MKKIQGFFSIIILTSFLFGFGSFVDAEDDIMKITQDAGYTDVLEINKPQSSIIIDGNNGQILWAQEPDMPRDPASISKMMTVFLLFEDIAAGKLSLDTTITASETDEAIADIYEISNNNIVNGVEYPVHELLTMIVVPSSNAATVMIANYLSENDATGFVRRMNEKAVELGMLNTYFNNCSGASADNFADYYNPDGYDIHATNQSTARDLATMTFHLINRYPQILDFTSKPEVTVMAGTPYEEHFETYNYSLPGAAYGIEGVDGLKTGSSSAAAFNYIATAKRGETRLIEVILGVGDWSDQQGEYYRHPFGNALLEKVFAEYEFQEILPVGEHKIADETIYLDQPFSAVVKKDAKPELALKDGQVVLANSPEIVAGTIEPAALAYHKSEVAAQVANNPEMANDPRYRLLNTFTSVKEFCKKNLIGIIFLIIGIVLALASLAFPSKEHKKTASLRDERRESVSIKPILLGLAGIFSVGGVVLILLATFLF
ncbi:D-alanyl-D-alanine carboxypeptidase [Enterococcus sp. PF1-24]|uniref:DUF1958 domain-containing protein n=1 Tax=unclassified Enterococcus TaxID=2608891 RepID=UPI00247652E8|nr:MULTISPECIES: serine hydrolase [unclassified Enterococcus]MDH6363815.1 D-alanyl-D-alanine carboxypeptidase [Enterococcus sp. PFB1-1]MDH6400999.1 D-alanyl-D-alanine carboxypeptidase [Enterococcus sp. PF1-24]